MRDHNFVQAKYKNDVTRFEKIKLKENENPC